MINWLKNICLFFLLNFCSVLAIAQFVTIGTGVSSQDKLFGTFYEDHISIASFSDAELTAVSPALNVGDTIYSIGWYVNSLGGQAMYGANITISEIGYQAVTLWTGTLSPVLGWNDIILQNPYVRQSSGSLTVQYCYDNCENTSTFTVLKTNANSTNQWDRSNGSSGCNLNNFTVHNGRPNIRFGKTLDNVTNINITHCAGNPTILTSSPLTFNTSISGFNFKGTFNGNYYFLSNSSKDWLEADLNCRQNGGYLACIENVNENDFVKNNVINSTSWIGYHQNCNSGLFSEPFGGWQWTNGSITNYTNWNNNEPNDFFGFFSENYVEMYTTGKWNDHQKTQINPYVMEVEESFLWNTGSTSPSISVNPTVNTTYWVYHTLGTETITEYFNVIIASGDGCTDPNSCNYDPLANCDDGSCTGILGCIDPAACNYNSLANCDDGSCVSGLVTIDTINIQHIACPNGGDVGIASILQSDYTNHSWLNISNGQLYNGGGGNGGLYRNDLAAGLYVITASMPTNPLCNNIAYSDTFEILEAEPLLQYSPTQSCPSACNVIITADMLLAISGVNYTYQLDANNITSLPNSLSNQCGGAHTYEIFADGIGCGIENISISQQAPMNLLTSVINASCTLQGSATVVIESIGSSGLNTYCYSEPQNNYYTTIDNVLLFGNTTSISNNTTSIPDMYTDFTSFVADVIPGSSYNLTIDLGKASNTSAHIENIANVYVDWNIDGDFNDTNELVAQVAPTLSPSTHTVTINVPLSAIPGQSRMRIVAQNYQYQPTNQALPCDYQIPYFGSTEDYTIQINGSVATPIFYLWSDGQTSSTASNLSAGTYTVQITDANGCTSTDTAIVSGFSANISVTASSDQIICNGDIPSNLTATSSGLGSYSWTPSNDFLNPNIQNPIFNGGITNSTTYMVTFTDTNGCTVSDDVIINVNSIPSASLTAVPNQVCLGDNVQLNANTNIPVNLYRFQYNTGLGWQNIITTNVGGWGVNSIEYYNNILNSTQFRVKVREDWGCTVSNWSPVITLPISNIITPLISHN